MNNNSKTIQAAIVIVSHKHDTRDSCIVNNLLLMILKMDSQRCKVNSMLLRLVRFIKIKELHKQLSCVKLKLGLKQNYAKRTSFVCNQPRLISSYNKRKIVFILQNYKRAPVRLNLRHQKSVNQHCQRKMAALHQNAISYRILANDLLLNQMN